VKRTALVWILGTVLALVFWWPIVAGKTRVGGDIYNYYLPLKMVYADGLRDGQIWLWTPRVGYGAPMLADSQVGVFYPINLVLYSLLPVFAAFEVSFLLHFVLCFGFTYHFCRTLRLGVGASLVGAAVFTYGWFPVRGVLEWAYVTGIWIPLAMVGVERRLRGDRWTCLWTTVLALSMQLLAGHFQAAWFTLLLAALYSLARICFEPQDRARRLAWAGSVAAACVLAVGLCAVQLLPTWELRSVGQRGGERWQDDVVRESVPAWFLGQVFYPWHTYCGGPAMESPIKPANLAGPKGVEGNLYPGLLILWLVGAAILSRKQKPQVRAWLAVLGVSLLLMTGVGMRWLVHLPGFGFFRYPGRYSMISMLALAALAAIGVQYLRELSRRRAVILTGVLIVPQVLMILVTFGPALGLVSLDGLVCWMARTFWGVPASEVAKWTPKEASGVAAVARMQLWLLIGLGVCAAAAGLLYLLARIRRTWLVVPLVLTVCMVEYYPLSRQVTNQYFISGLPETLAQSPIKKQVGPNARLVAPGKGLFTMMEVGCLPPYMGLGPRLYFDRDWTLEPFLDNKTRPTARQWELLHLAGVSHVVSNGELLKDDRLELVWREEPGLRRRDPFIYRVWARSPGDAALHVYRVRGYAGRAYLAHPDSTSPATALGTARVVWEETTPHRVVVEVAAREPCHCVLADLDYPGWHVEVDGRPSHVEPFRDALRAVRVAPGNRRVVFRYKPASVARGLWVSIGFVIALAGLAAVAFVRRRRSGDPA